MSSVINASISSNGIVSTADASGILLCQSNGVTTNARAWVNFDGTLSTPITPRANYNISSVTKNATGDYTLNFTVALTDANYSVVASSSGNYSSTNSSYVTINRIASTGLETAPTTSAVRINSVVTTGTANDIKYICVAVFGQ